jgi:hypothetical protein
MKHSGTAITAALALALSAGLAAAQSDQQDRNRGAAEQQHQAQPAQAQPRQNTQALPSRDQRSATDGERRIPGAEPQHGPAQNLPAPARPENAQMQPNREQRSATDRDRRPQGMGSEPQRGQVQNMPAQPQNAQSQPNREQRTATEQERRQQGFMGSEQQNTEMRPNREQRTTTERERTGFTARTQSQNARTRGEEHSAAEHWRGDERARGFVGSEREHFATGSERITERQRTELQERIGAAPLHRVDRLGFSLNVGAVVPRRERLYALPATIVSVTPQYRGYRYIADRERIVIVEPRTMRIVTVLPEGEALMGAGTPPGSLRLHAATGCQ